MNEEMQSISGNDISGNDISGNDVSGNDMQIMYDEVIEAENTETESTLSKETLGFYESIETEIKTINGLLTTILFFIIFTWVEKKIKNSVKKWTVDV